jgi:hypothetical protein
LDTSDTDLKLVEKIRELTDGNGSTITIDTTGVVSLIKDGLDFIGTVLPSRSYWIPSSVDLPRNAADFEVHKAPKGQMILVGIPPPDGTLDVNLQSFLSVRIQQIKIAIEFF